MVKAAEASLAGQGYVAPIDVLVGIGWLNSGAVKRWRKGQIDFLEREVQVQVNVSRISEAMHHFRSWATERLADQRNALRGARAYAAGIAF